VGVPGKDLGRLRKISSPKDAEHCGSCLVTG